MLVQHLPQLVQHRVVLASASPRRQELLILLGLQVRLCTQAADASQSAALSLLPLIRGLVQHVTSLLWDASCRDCRQGHPTPPWRHT